MALKISYCEMQDFGLSAILGPDATHASNFTCGTRFYCAPEVGLPKHGSGVHAGLFHQAGFAAGRQPCSPPTLLTTSPARRFCTRGASPLPLMCTALACSCGKCTATCLCMSRIPMMADQLSIATFRSTKKAHHTSTRKSLPGKHMCVVSHAAQVSSICTMADYHFGCVCANVLVSNQHQLALTKHVIWCLQVPEA
jgi:hypothetical protein